jgi:hypothetical protein
MGSRILDVVAKRKIIYIIELYNCRGGSTTFRELALLP